MTMLVARRVGGPVVLTESTVLTMAVLLKDPSVERIVRFCREATGDAHPPERVQTFVIASARKLARRGFVRYSDRTPNRETLLRVTDRGLAASRGL